MVIFEMDKETLRGLLTTAAALGSLDFATHKNVETDRLLDIAAKLIKAIEDYYENGGDKKPNHR